jgi:homoserine kinase
VIVAAPASSANLGPGFDCLGLAVDLPFHLSDSPSDEPADPARPGRGWLVVEPSHPAAAAFVAAGGDPSVELWWRSPIPPGRGLGFSGAARVAGAYLAGRRDELDHDVARDGALHVATELEGHADNAVASALGGFTVAAGDASASLAAPAGLELLVWWPQRSTSTDESRRVLPTDVPLADAAYSIARAALWVAAVATGDAALLREACQDRVHQPGRLGARPDVAAALERLLGEPSVAAAWLSGSGPTVAALVDGAQVAALESLLADEAADGSGLPEGRVRRLAVARTGVRIVAPGDNPDLVGRDLLA